MGCYSSGLQMSKLPSDHSTLCCSLIMFYFIALAGAHKRVVTQLREQLSLVRKHAGPEGRAWGHFPRTPNGKMALFPEFCGPHHHRSPKTMPSGQASSNFIHSMTHSFLQYILGWPKNLLLFFHKIKTHFSFSPIILLFWML